MTGEIDLRGSGTLARIGFEGSQRAVITGLGRILELFNSGHSELAAELLRQRNNSKPTQESMKIVIREKEYFSEVEMRKWFIDVGVKDQQLSDDLLDFKFNLFSDWDSSVAADSAFEMYRSGNLGDRQKMIASEMLLESGSPEKAILVVNSIESSDLRVPAYRLAVLSAKAIKKIELQADAWREIGIKFGIGDDDVLIAASRMYSAGRYSEVIDLLERRTFDEMNRSLKLLLGRSYFTLEDYENCLVISRLVLERRPDDEDALRLIIRSKRRLGNVGDEEGLQALRRSLALGTIHPEDAYRLARLSVEDEDWAQASKAIDAIIYDKSYKISDKHIILKSRILSGTGRLEEARDWLVSNDDGNSVSITRTLASILHELRDDEGSLEARRKVLEHDPQDTGIRRGVCTSLLRLRRYDEAMLESKEIIRALPTDASAWEVLIETLARMGRMEQVDIAWKKILEMSWHNHDGLILAVDICLRFDWQKRLDWILRSRLHITKMNGIRSEIHHMMMQKGRFDLSRTHEKYLGPRSVESSMIARSLENDLGQSRHTIMEIAEKEELQTETVILKNLIRRKENSSRISTEDRSALLITGSLNAGGAEKQVILTAAGLVCQGWKAAIGVDRIDAQYSGETLLSLAESLGLKVNQFRDSHNESDESDNLIHQHEKLLSHLRPVERERTECIVRMILKIRPSIIHAWQDAMIYPAAIASLIVGSTVLVGSVRSLNPNEKSLLHGRKRPFLKRSLQMLCRFDNFKLLNNSQAGRESYARWLDIPVNDIGLVRNGILENHGAMIDLKKILNLPVDSELVGGVFRLVPEKRPLLWVDSTWECIRNRKNAFGVIIGDGRMREEVEARIHQIGAHGKIILHGFREDTILCYDSFNVTLLTSSSEGLPNVLIESQARGVPVVSTNVGGVRECMSNGLTGKLLKNDDVRSIKSALTDVLDSWDPITTKSECQSFVMERFGLDRMTKETRDIYDSLVSGM